MIKKYPVEKTKLALGLPVYNAEKSIRRVIEEISSQTFTDWKLVARDNCSTDKSLQILINLELKDPRISVLKSEKNEGSIENFNKVFRHTNSQYFAWIPADDSHKKEFFESCIEILDSQPNVILCACETIMRDELTGKPLWKSNLDSFSGNLSLKERYKEALENFPAVAMYGMFRSSALQKSRLFPKVIGGDMLLMQEMALYGDFRCVSKILFTRIGRKNWNSLDQDYRVFYGDNFRLPSTPPFILVSIEQFKILWNSKLTLIQKIEICPVLIKFQVKQVLKKVLIKLIHLLPIHRNHKLKIGVHFYWEFLHNPNVTVIDDERYLERIIKPIIRF